MARNSTINISLPKSQLRRLRQSIGARDFRSPSDAIREGLNLLFDQRGVSTDKTMTQKLAAGYRASARVDRRMAQEWDEINDAWPAE